MQTNYTLRKKGSQWICVNVTELLCFSNSLLGDLGAFVFDLSE